MGQLIDHFHEFRKEFLVQCEIFRVQIQNTSNETVKNTAEIASVMRDIEAMKRELNKMGNSLQPRKSRHPLVAVVTEPIVVVAVIAVFLIFLVADLNVKKEKGILNKVVSAIPGVAADE